MKKLISALAAAVLFATLLAGCGSGASSSASASSEAASSTASEAASTDASSIDDFSMENEMNLTPDNIVAFQGDVTNDQADCALVFAAQVKDGTADAVKAELEAYKESMSSTLYADFADKVAKAQDARIVVKGNVVVMVIAGVNGPDYSAIDTAIDGALA